MHVYEIVNTINLVSTWIDMNMSSLKMTRVSTKSGNFISKNLSNELRNKVANGSEISKEEIISWQKLFIRKIYLLLAGKKNLVGKLSASKRYILDQELALADTPTIIPRVTMIGLYNALRHNKTASFFFQNS